MRQRETRRLSPSFDGERVECFSWDLCPLAYFCIERDEWMGNDGEGYHAVCVEQCYCSWNIADPKDCFTNRAVSLIQSRDGEYCKEGLMSDLENIGVQINVWRNEY